ncbi:hypothetical protein Tco_1384675 [Tanacetum coccineum]
MILSGADNRPPMLEKDLYDSWKSRMELYMQNREHGRMILESVEHGPLIWPTVEENNGDSCPATVQGRQGQNYSGNTYKSNATSSRGNTTSGQARVVKCIQKALSLTGTEAGSYVPTFPTMGSDVISA